MRNREIIDRYKAAFQAFYGWQPKIEVVGGWYRVNGAAKYRARDLDRLAARAEKMCRAKENAKQETLP